MSADARKARVRVRDPLPSPGPPGPPGPPFASTFLVLRRASPCAEAVTPFTLLS